MVNVLSFVRPFGTLTTVMFCTREYVRSMDDDIIILYALPKYVLPKSDIYIAIGIIVTFEKKNNNDIL